AAAATGLAGRRTHCADRRAARDPARHAHDGSPASRGSRGGRHTVGRASPRACRRGLASDRRAARRVPRTKGHAMARLIYAMNTSLDGYISDRDGKFEWGAPTPELFAAINELEGPIGTYLYGRHLYETMAVWDTAHLEAGGPAFTPGLLELEREFAPIWRAPGENVVSSTPFRAPPPRPRAPT